MEPRGSFRKLSLGHFADPGLPGTSLALARSVPQESIPGLVIDRQDSMQLRQGQDMLALRERWLSRLALHWQTRCAYMAAFRVG